MIRKLPEEEEIRILQVKYGLISQEIKKFKNEGFTFRDIDKGRLYAYISEQPLEHVLQLRKYYPWMMIEKKLNLTPEIIHDKTLRYRAECAERWWNMDAKEVYRLMNEGYPRHSIKLAWILALHSSMKIEDILKSKNRTISWKSWAQQNLGITPEEFSKWIQQYLNPSMPRKDS